MIFFKQIIVDATELASEIDGEISFNTSNKYRVRSKYRQFNYECCDEPIIDPKEKYKIEVVFFYIIDSLELRFSQISHHNKYFEFLYNIYN